MEDGQLKPEDVAGEYGDAIIRALGAAAETIPAQTLLSICLALQEQLEPLTQKEPTAKAATRLVTQLASLARLANKTVAEGQRKLLELAERQMAARDAD